MAKTKAQTGPRTEPHAILLSVDEVVQQLKSNLDSGLTAQAVAEIQKTHPPNELEGGGAIPWYKTLGKQLCNAMILVRQGLIIITRDELIINRYLCLLWLSASVLKTLLKEVY